MQQVRLPRAWTGPGLVGLVLVGVLALAGCSSSATPPGGDASSAGPGTASTRSAPTPKPSAIDAAPDPSSLPTTRDATALASTRRNEIGEPWTLDASAAAACAQAEFAMSAIDGGADPSRHLATAVTAAGASATEAVHDAAAGLAGGSADRGTVVSFLKVCTQGGYEL